jgi:hypothetical protein
MTQRWIKYLNDPTGYISIKDAMKRLHMDQNQIYHLLEFEQVTLVRINHEDYFEERIYSRFQDPNELGDLHQPLWEVEDAFLEDSLEYMKPCSLEDLKALIAAGSIPAGRIFRHHITLKRVRYNGHELEPLGIAS